MVVPWRKIRVLLTFSFLGGTCNASSPPPWACWELSYQKWTPTACVAKDGFQMPRCTNLSDARWPIRDYTLVRLPFSNIQNLSYQEGTFTDMKCRPGSGVTRDFCKNVRQLCTSRSRHPRATSLSQGTLVSGYTCHIDVEPSMYKLINTFIIGRGEADCAVTVCGYLK
jgi:hypothetical protein